MKYTTVKYSALATVSLFAVSLVIPTGAMAEEIVLEIEGNGSGSSNEVSVTTQAQTTVTQTNDMQVTNNVDAGANTGENLANSNTLGTVGIVTGDATVDVNIANSGNTSTVSTDCCNGGTTGAIVISGNGAYSQNSVNASLHNGINVSVFNNANITNSVNGKAITGKNDANYNLGDVFIKTGSITARETITNGLFNIANVSVGVKSIDFSVKIKDNGAYSENNLNLDQIAQNSVNIENNFTVANYTDWELVTGQNSANENLGDVLIATGDIYYESVITNSGNVASVEIFCCPMPPAAPVTPVTPPSPPTSVNPGTGGSSGPSSSSGSSSPGLGGILPVTGANFLFLFLLLNTMFLLFGAFLKLRAGRSPALAYAF